MNPALVEFRLRAFQEGEWQQSTQNATQPLSRRPYLVWLSLNQIARSYGLLEAIAARVASEQAQLKPLADAHLEWAQSLAPGSAPLPRAIEKLEADGSRLRQLLELDIESFYLFAKICLAKVAQFVQLYFGQHRDCSLTSHHRFCESWDRYMVGKGLVFDDDIRSLADRLLHEIVEHRDKQVEHLDQHVAPHMVRSVNADEAGCFRLMQFPGALPNVDKPIDVVTSGSVPVLLALIAEWIDAILRFIEVNRDRAPAAGQAPQPPNSSE